MKPDATLHQLKLSVPDGHLPESYGVYFKNTLVALCHALEDHILKTTSADPDQRPLLLVTFQEGKWYAQEAARYLELAQASCQVAICAVPDSGFAQHPTSQLDNVSLIDLDHSDTLVNEWNLIILAPGYRSMVLCHELSPEEYHAQGFPENDMERKFYGLWTFDSDLVVQAAKILIQQIDRYQPELATQLQQNLDRILNTTSTDQTDLSGVVSRVVSYLQTTQQQMVAVTRQTRELWELEGRALRVSRNINANKLQAFLRMAQRVDERDRANPLASLQVAALAETLGQLLDLPTVKLRRLRLAGLLFRVGLASAPNEIFAKPPAQLDEASLVFWRDRATLTEQLLKAMPELAAVTNIVLHHLEHWDGSGRPDGLRGEMIAIESRILGLVAHFQEMLQSRGDRPSKTLSEALADCAQFSGTRFDPALVESLGTVVRLSEMGMMTLPDRPSQLPNVWLDEPLQPAQKPT